MTAEVVVIEFGLAMLGYKRGDRATVARTCVIDGLLKTGGAKLIEVLEVSSSASGMDPAVPDVEVVSDGVGDQQGAGAGQPGTAQPSSRASRRKTRG